MLRSAFHITAVVLAGCAFSLLVILFGFFASPSAVRTSPPSAFSTILFEHLQNR